MRKNIIAFGLFSLGLAAFGVLCINSGTVLNNVLAKLFTAMFIFTGAAPIFVEWYTVRLMRRRLEQRT